MLKQIVVVVLLCGFVMSEEDTKKNGEEETEDRWFPFLQEQQENTTSPQMSMKDRKLVISDSPFVEDFPPGEFHLNDAVLSAEQHDKLFKELPIKVGRAIIDDDKLRWTNAIIPYYLDCSIEKLENAVAAIKAAMAEWERKTCIRFKPRTNEKNYLRFIRDTHCWGHVGMNSYSTISCGFGCEQQNVMSHEIGHAVGFYHEQNRKDRDNWVTVMWNNIGQFKSAFKKVKNTYSLGVAYDYASIMHYPWNAFSSNGQNTMVPKRNYGRLQPYVEISRADIQQTSLMYKCRGRYRINDEIEKQLSDEGIDISSELFSAGCADQSGNCKAWKDAGYCKIYSHVIKYCPTTCEDPKCSGGGGGGGSCKDSNEHCPGWSKQGYCNSNAYVEKNCCKSCKGTTKPPKPPSPPPPTTAPTTTTTTTTKRPCTNGKKYCKAWAKAGYCDANSEHFGFMEDHCCLACRELTKKPCINKQAYCKAWAEKGYCKDGNEYAGFMKDKCCLACRGGRPPTRPPTRPPKPTGKPVTAKPVTEKPEPEVKPTPKPVRRYLGTGVLCEDTRQDCSSLALRGECRRNPAWMAYYCKKSCNMKCDQPGLKPSGACANPLGLSYKSRNMLPDSAFKSPLGYLSTGGWNAYPWNARLYFPDTMSSKRIGAWCAPTGKTSPQTRQSLTINLQYRKRVTHIATQGRDKYWERISEFKIAYSNDGYTYYPYKENGKERVFHGSCDYRTPVLNKFNTPIVAKYIKYLPWKWNYPCVRMELYGCNA